MTREIKFPTASPAASDNHQPFSDLDWRMIAYLLATGGDLHPYLPKQPDWCQTIGDDVWSILQSGEPVIPRDRRRLSTAFLAARLNKPDSKLSPELRLSCWQTVDEFFATELDESAAVSGRNPE